VRDLDDGQVAVGAQNILHLHRLDHGQCFARLDLCPSVTAMETTMPGIGQSSMFEVSGGSLIGISLSSVAVFGNITRASTDKPFMQGDCR
jgi:hypothetical protein